MSDSKPDMVALMEHRGEGHRRCARRGHGRALRRAGPDGAGAGCGRRGRGPRYRASWAHRAQPADHPAFGEPAHAQALSVGDCGIAGEFITVARVLGPQGRRGEVLAELHTDFPERFEERRNLWWLGARRQPPRIAARRALVPQGRRGAEVCRRGQHQRCRAARGVRTAGAERSSARSWKQARRTSAKSLARRLDRRAASDFWGVSAKYSLGPERRRCWW